MCFIGVFLFVFIVFCGWLRLLMLVCLLVIGWLVRVWLFSYTLLDGLFGFVVGFIVACCGLVCLVDWLLLFFVCFALLFVRCICW